MNASLVQVQRQYVAKKALFSFLGNTFRIFDTTGGLQFYIKQKAFKLKEEINVFADEQQSEKRLTIKARGIGDFSGTYDIVDATTGESLGAGQRSGFKSMFKDEWSILDADGGAVGRVVETGGAMIFIRKFFKFIPQKYQVEYLGDVVGSIHQKFNPFQLAYDVDFSAASDFDPRLGVGMVVLLLAIEGAQA
ncbi:MAG: hypothetical protein H6738_11685 [Alphaproteobacteria bacterium]|nr:hypothetical protein [Alphaproteobacteria bacterium]MCB9697433.1 hypothetical protein [Alphaproteobacteria bacterium]